MKMFRVNSDSMDKILKRKQTVLVCDEEKLCTYKGDKIHIYEQSPGCRFAESVCTEAKRISINLEGGRANIILNGVELKTHAKVNFIKSLGFSLWSEYSDWALNMVERDEFHGIAVYFGKLTEVQK